MAVRGRAASEPRVRVVSAEHGDFVTEYQDLDVLGCMRASPTTALILTSEMVDDNGNKKEKPVDKQKVLNEATLSEMKEHNPDLSR
jgi:hypothetical protein